MIRAARALLGPPARLVRKVHRRLLPARPEIGWTPYLWLFYLSFVFWRWFLQPPPAAELTLSLFGVAAFLVLYFNGHWHQGPRVLVNMAGIVVVGLLLTPINPGALTFFVYAAGFAGFVGEPRRGWFSILAILGAVLAAAWVFAMPWFWTVLTLLLTLMIGAVNIYYAEVGRKNEALRLSQEEVGRLASVAERERIARDLHDLLGHTLTTITVKAELARRLSERGDERAAREIADVERISRQALAQVREAVAGFADIGLEGELKRARLVCEARGIELEGAPTGPESALDAGLQDTGLLDAGLLDAGLLDAQRETALAMVLREAITNVVRHSRAARCTVRLERRRSSVALIVEDDGCGGRPGSRGHGLGSMRERLERLGGGLDIETKLGPEGGFRVTAELPCEPMSQEEAAQDRARGEDGVSALPEPA